MPITLLTGMPGNGKTLLMMEQLHAAAEDGSRPLFAAGVDGLQPGLATELADPRRWSECPDGSLIFVDEAWKWFGHLHDARNQPTPAHVLGLAEHRHRGIDFVWTTQMPNQLYPFVRGLIADHWHVVRRFGTRWIDVYKWGELNDDVKSQGKRDIALRDSRTLPLKFGRSYKSATQHTIKAKLPWKVWLLPLCLVVGAVLCWYAYLLLRPSAMTETINGKGQDTPQGVAAPVAADRSGVGKSAPLWASTEDYLAAHAPRIPAMPWSAPVFDKRGATADPQVFCGVMGEGQDANGDYKFSTCSCLTEQGTHYEIDDAQCRNLAINGGVYNPYKERSRQQPAGGRDQRPSMARSAAPLPSTVALEAPQQVRPGYGQFKGEPTPADPALVGL